MPRFFVEQLNEDKAEITGGDAWHIARSLRMKNGDALTLCSCGTEYLCRIAKITDEVISLDIVESSFSKAEPNIELTLYQALPKQDKLEHIVQKAAELGASRIVPVITRRCVSRPDRKDFEKRLMRLNKISLEAAKQAGRGIVPEVSMLYSFEEAIYEMVQSDFPLMCCELGGKNFSEAGLAPNSKISLFIGSEGGFEASEAEAAKNSGITPIWLGQRILRCETAPVTAMSIILFLTGNI